MRHHVVSSKERLIPAASFHGYLTDLRPRRKHQRNRNVQNVLKATGIKSGINPEATVHKVRHSFATHIIQSGVDIWNVEEYLGYQSVMTTEIYTYI